jgi:putative MFS transporter
MFLSTLLFSRIPDMLGRRVSLIWSMAIYSFFNILIAFSSNSGWINFYRLAAGFSVGVQPINNDSFLAEITPRYLRGRYMAFALAFILRAVPISAALGALFVPRSPFGTAGWRWVVGIGGLGGLTIWFMRRAGIAALAGSAWPNPRG